MSFEIIRFNGFSVVPSTAVRRNQQGKSIDWNASAPKPLDLMDTLQEVFVRSCTASDENIVGKTHDARLSQ